MELASSDAMAVRFALPVLHSTLSLLGRLKPFFSFWKRKKRMGSKTLPVCAERRQPPLGKGAFEWTESSAPAGVKVNFKSCKRADEYPRGAGRICNAPSSRTAALGIGPLQAQPGARRKNDKADALFGPLSAGPKRKDATFVASFFLERVTRLARAAQRPDTHAGTERPHRGLSSADADALFEPLSAEPKRKDATFVASFFLERVTRLELATSTLARWRSTG